MIALESQIRRYDWGSRIALASMQGREVPSAGPEAELWLGAHPAASSKAGDRLLSELVSEDPHALLGDGVVRRFGPRLPFLLKVLAAEAPLSIQVHPDAEQARAGYESGKDSYCDPYPKPELLVAVSQFEALCGFADPAATAEVLCSLRVAALEPVIGALRGPDRSRALRDALALLLAWPQPQRADLVNEVVASGHPMAMRLAKGHPRDIGVVVGLLLNHVSLEPGQAIFMPAGNVHAYLTGAAVEIMGASDNVLRAGLTTKRIDPAELMRLVRYEVLTDPLFPAQPLEPGLDAWRPPVPEFSLVRGLSTPRRAVTLPGDGPRIVLCVRGTAAVRTDGASAQVRAGTGVFIGAHEPPVEVSGDAEVFQASPSAGT